MAAIENQKEDDRDAQLSSLREELAKAKAALKDSAHKNQPLEGMRTLLLSHTRNRYGATLQRRLR